MQDPNPPERPDYMGDPAPLYQREMTYDEQQRMQYEPGEQRQSIQNALAVRNSRDYNTGQRGGVVGPPVGPVVSQYDRDFNRRVGQLSEQMNMLALPGENHRIADPAPPQVLNFPSGPSNTDPTTGGGTGEWHGGRSRPLGLARRPAQAQSGQPRPHAQFSKVQQALPRHVLRQAALQRPLNKATSGGSRGAAGGKVVKTTPSRVGGGKR